MGTLGYTDGVRDAKNVSQDCVHLVLALTVIGGHEDSPAIETHLLARERGHLDGCTRVGQPAAVPLPSEWVELEPVVQRGYIRNKAEKYAREVPGYSLICVIVGR